MYFDITVKDIIIGNFLGFFKFIGGILVSFIRLFSKRTRPDIIFLKGGYVCLPVGLVARLFRIPYIIHESDAVAGLANRLLIKKAKFVAFGMPLTDEVQKSHPNYVWTGIPVGPEFKAVTPTRMMSLKKAFSFNPEKPLVVITGGSQGAKDLNETTRLILPELLKFASVGLVAGRKYYEDMIDLKDYENWDHASLESNFRMWEFSNVMDEVMGAADVVVSRAGATTVAELKSKFVKKNELKLGLVVTVLNPDGDNKPVDYWYYHPYDETTESYDTTAAPDWYPKPYPGSGGTGDIFWQDGAAPGTAGYEAWKDAGIE